MNMASKFHHVYKAARRIGLSRGFHVVANSAHNCESVEISKYSNRVRARLTLARVGEYVDLVRYEDCFLISAKLLTWMHLNVPYFPYLAKIELKELLKLSIDLTEEEFEHEIALALNKAHT